MRLIEEEEEVGEGEVFGKTPRENSEMGQQFYKWMTTHFNIVRTSNPRNQVQAPKKIPKIRPRSQKYKEVMKKKAAVSLERFCALHKDTTKKESIKVTVRQEPKAVVAPATDSPIPKITYTLNKPKPKPKEDVWERLSRQKFDPVPDFPTYTQHVHDYYYGADPIDNPQLMDVQVENWDEPVGAQRPGKKHRNL